MKSLASVVPLLFSDSAHLGYGDRLPNKPAKFSNKSCHWSEFKPNYELMTLNPLVPESTRKDAHVTGYQNFLIEFDESPLEEQRDLLNTEFPFTTAAYSGKKSIHFVLHVLDAPTNKLEYSRFAQALFEAVERCCGMAPDRACKNPSRFTRTPGAVRVLEDGTETEQELLAIKRAYTREELIDLLGIEMKPEPVKPERKFQPSGSYVDWEIPEEPGTFYSLHRYDQEILMGVRPITSPSRNQALFQLACNAARRNIPVPELWELIVNLWCEELGLSETEVQQTVESAYSTVGGY